MTTEHDFKSTIHDFQFSFTKEEYGHHYDTILFALRLADKLLKQEPSEGMIVNFYEKTVMTKEGCIWSFNDGFKAMIEQAVKEIENDRI